MRCVSEGIEGRMDLCKLREENSQPIRLQDEARVSWRSDTQRTKCHLNVIKLVLIVHTHTHTHTPAHLNPFHSMS